MNTIKVNGIAFYESKYEGYMVSKCGKVFSLHTNKLRSFNTSNKGYNLLYINNRRKNFRKNVAVHRLVAETFIPNPDNLPCVNHIDGNKTNNSVENLEWCTQKQNVNHSWENGISKYTKRGRYIPIVAINKSTKEVFEFESIREAGRVLGLNQSNIGKVLKGKVKTCGNYEWRYSNEV